MLCIFLNSWPVLLLAKQEHVSDEFVWNQMHSLQLMNQHKVQPIVLSRYLAMHDKSNWPNICCSKGKYTYIQICIRAYTHTPTYMQFIYSPIFRKRSCHSFIFCVKNNIYVKCNKTLSYFGVGTLQNHTNTHTFSYID